MINSEIDSLTQQPKRWHALELFRVVYPDDEDFDKLDILYPGRIGYIIKNEDGTINRIVIARTWPHAIDDKNEGLFSADE
jgi:hypothetical protein